jgi:hypothetical protein
MAFKVGIHERKGDAPCFNQQVFATHDEAHRAGVELLSRWLLPESFSVVETDEPVTYEFPADIDRPRLLVRKPTIGNILDKPASTLDEILAKMDNPRDVRIAIRFNRATAVVLFECLDLSSSNLGARTVLCVGPHCSAKGLADINGQHLGDVPSRFQWPVEWALVDWTRDGVAS